MKKICENCHKEYVTDHADRKYCSRTCMYEAIRKLPEDTSLITGFYNKEGFETDSQGKLRRVFEAKNLRQYVAYWASANHEFLEIAEANYFEMFPERRATETDNIARWEWMIDDMLNSPSIGPVLVKEWNELLKERQKNAKNSVF